MPLREIEGRALVWAARAALLAVACLATSCGDSGRRSPASSPKVDPLTGEGLFQPAPGRIHVRVVEEPPGVAPQPLPDVQRQSLWLIVPGAGSLEVRLLVAAVPAHAQLLGPAPGVRVLFEERVDVKGREGEGASAPVVHVSWACHVTKARDLVDKTLEGLVPGGLGADLDVRRRDWASQQLAEWWWRIGEHGGHVRGWSGSEDWVPRFENPMSATIGDRPRQSSPGLRLVDAAFTERDATAPILLGSWSWFYPGEGANGGTQSFIDARERLAFEELLPDGSVRAGGHVYARWEAPFLKWCLVARWQPAK